MRKVMVFGVFDGVHEGHREFLKEARSHGDYLIVVLTPDHIVDELKGHLPKKELGERMEELHREDHIDKIIEGDPELGKWDVVKKYHPDVIALGYDQDEIKKEILNHVEVFPWHLEIVTIPSHEPEVYKSSLINGN